jgi:hypothetical protein
MSLYQLWTNHRKGISTRTLRVSFKDRAAFYQVVKFLKEVGLHIHSHERPPRSSSATIRRVDGGLARHILFQRRPSTALGLRTSEDWRQNFNTGLEALPRSTTSSQDLSQSSTWSSSGSQFSMKPRSWNGEESISYVDDYLQSSSPDFHHSLQEQREFGRTHTSSIDHRLRQSAHGPPPRRVLPEYLTKGFRTDLVRTELDTRSSLNREHLGSNQFMDSVQRDTAHLSQFGRNGPFKPADSSQRIDPTVRPLNLPKVIKRGSVALPPIPKFPNIHKESPIVRPVMVNAEVQTSDHSVMPATMSVDETMQTVEMIRTNAATQTSEAFIHPLALINTCVDLKGDLQQVWNDLTDECEGAILEMAKPGSYDACMIALAYATEFQKRLHEMCADVFLHSGPSITCSGL